MGFARKLGFSLKHFSKLFPVKSDLMEAPLIFMPFIMKSSLFLYIKKRLLVYKNTFKNACLK